MTILGQSTIRKEVLDEVVDVLHREGLDFAVIL
jgi:hypothetical protein